MKNKKIIDSWNSIAPDESDEKRMLQAILDKNHNAEYEDHPDEDEVTEIITDEYTVSKGKTAKQILLTALPAAACVALIFGVVKFTSDHLPAGDNNDEINISAGETSGTVISEMTVSEKSTDSPTTSVSEIITVTDVPVNAITDVSDSSSAISSTETEKDSEKISSAVTDTPKDDKKETEKTNPAHTEPETNKEETPKTQKVTDQKYITTTVTTESKPRETLPEVTTATEVTTVLEEKKKIPLDFILEQFSRNSYLTWNALEKYKADDGGTEYQKQYRIENSNCALYATGNDNGYVTSAVLIFPESAWGERVDIYRNSPEQLLAFEGGVTIGLSAENIKQVTFTEYNTGKTIVLNNTEAFVFSSTIRRFHIGKQASGWLEYSGNLISFDIEYNDGTSRNISVTHPYIVVDGTAYYSTTEEILQFTEFADQLINNNQ
jgi:hypothetical protein